MSRTRLDDTSSDFRLLSAKAYASLRSYRERIRFSKAFYEELGYKTAAVSFRLPRRKGGDTKWSLLDLIKYSINAIVGSSSRPLYLSVVFSLVTFTIAVVLAIYTCIRYVQSGQEVPGYATIVVAMCFLAAMQLLGIGIISAYVGNLYIEVKARPHYLLGCLEENYNDN